MKYADKLKALSEQRAEEVKQEEIPTHRATASSPKEKQVQMNVKLPETLIDRFDQEILRRYPVGKRNRKLALTEAIEAWLNDSA